MYYPQTVSVNASGQQILFYTEDQLYNELTNVPGVEVIPKPHLPDNFNPLTNEQLAVYRIKSIHENVDFDYLPLNITELDLSDQHHLKTLIGNWLPLLRELNLTGCSQLNRLNLYGSIFLTSLNLTGCSNLRYVDVRLTGLGTVDISDCPPNIQLRTR